MAAELTVDAELNMPAELPCPDSSRVCTNAGSRPAVAGSLPAPAALAVVTDPFPTHSLQSSASPSARSHLPTSRGGKPAIFAHARFE